MLAIANINSLLPLIPLRQVVFDVWFIAEFHMSFPVIYYQLNTLRLTYVTIHGIVQVSGCSWFRVIVL